MRSLAFLACLFFSQSFFVSPALGETPEEKYHQVELKFADAQKLEAAGEPDEALIKYDDCAALLGELEQLKPPWKLGLVLDRLEECHHKADLLRPGVSASALGADRRPLAGSRRSAYPWKTSIVTTVFWIGEHPTAESWDRQPIEHNGGPDDHYEMSGYASSAHASMLNPFYVALPFNDLAHPDLAVKWLPDAWTRPTPDPIHPSVCKDRWIEIKNRAGRVCFAQWEDVGPITTDDAPYVFGPNRPAASRGLNVSPAVAKYLGIDSTAITSWRFVDDENVLPGMWLRYDEQAILFRALKEQREKDSNKTPSQ